MKISVRVVVILVVALVVLGLILGFIIPKVKDTSDKLVHNPVEEPEPPIPDQINKLTISRDVVKSSSLQNVIKASLFNPSEDAWDVIEYWGVLFKGCAVADSVCFVDSSDALCDELSKDADCGANPTKMPGDGCLVRDGDDSDPDCAPSDILLEVYCDNELVGESYVQDIPSKSFRTFTILFEVPPTLVKGKFHDCVVKSISPEPTEKAFSLYLEK